MTGTTTVAGWVLGPHRPASPMSASQRDRARRIGATLGAAVPGALVLVASVTLALAPSGRSDGEADSVRLVAGFVAIGASLGAVIGLGLGWRSGPWIASLGRSPEPGVVARFALRSVVLGAIAVACLTGTGMLVQDRPPEPITGLTDTVGAMAYGLAVAAMSMSVAFVYGLGLLGIPALIGTVGIVVLWARLVRAMVGPLDTGLPADDVEGPTETTGTIASTETGATAGAPIPRSIDGGFVRRLRSTDLGWIGAMLTVAAALGLTTLRASADSGVGPGMTLLAILATFVAFAGPGFVGAIGAATGRRTLLIAAGIACLPLSILAFSGVTLMLLVPACLFLYAGLKIADGARGRPAQAGLVGALVGLLVVGGLAPFLATETVCWDRYAGSDIGIVVRMSPDEPNGPSEIAVVASGCDGGQTSAFGGLLTLAAISAAVGLAVARSDRPSDPPSR